MRTGSPFGTVFSRARESYGLSVYDVSEATKISSTVLIALESDDISSLPGGIYTLGFVRSYAKEIGLDPYLTARDYKVRFPEVVASDASHGTNESRAHEEFLSKQRMARTVLAIVLLSIPCVTFLIFFGVEENGITNSTGLADGVEVRSVPTPNFSETALLPSLDGDDLSSGETNSEGEVAQQVGRQPTPAVESSFPGQFDSTDVETDAIRPLVIEVHPNGDCWVSATVDGSRLVGRVMRAGEREVLEVYGDAIIIIGDAGTFSFTLNEQPGRSLGTSGQVVTVRITSENYENFVIEQLGS